MTEGGNVVIWCRDFHDDRYTDAAMRDVRRFRGIRLMLGDRVGDRFPSDATVELRSQRKPTDYFMAGPFPIVSSKLKRILERFGVKGEFISVALVRRDDSAIAGRWYCFNVTNVVDCFDRDRSECQIELGFATNVERVLIHEEKCGDSPLVLTAKTIPFLLLVRDDLANAIVAAGCSGIVFKSPKEWRNPVNPTL